MSIYLSSYFRTPKQRKVLRVIVDYLYLTFSHRLMKSVMQLMLPWKWATDILTRPSCTRMKQLLGRP